MAAPFALVKCFRKSALKVDLGRVRTHADGPNWGNSAPSPNGRGSLTPPLDLCPFETCLAVAVSYTLSP